MYIAKCMFENAYGFSKTYDYKINQKQRLALKRGDNVIVTRKKGGYAIAIVESVDIMNPDMADIITEHVCCKIVDEFYTEDEDE